MHSVFEIKRAIEILCLSGTCVTLVTAMEFFYSDFSYNITLIQNNAEHALLDAVLILYAEFAKQTFDENEEPFSWIVLWHRGAGGRRRWPPATRRAPAEAACTPKGAALWSGDSKVQVARQAACPMC